MLTGRLLAEGHNVTVYDNLMYNQTSLFLYCGMHNFRFIKAGVMDSVPMIEAIYESDIIIPLAAIVGADACKDNIKGTQETNYEAIKRIIMGRVKQKIIFPSTDSVYGKAGEEVCTEKTEPNPQSWYASLKARAEDELLQKGNCVVLRQATVFGASLRMRTDLMLNDFVRKATCMGYIRLYESGVHRNFIYIGDLCDAYLHVIENFDEMDGQIYNVGSDACNLTKLEIAEKVKEQIPEFEIIVNDESGTDPDKRDYTVSNEKLAETGFKAGTGVEHGISELKCLYEMFPKGPFRNA